MENQNNGQNRNRHDNNGGFMEKVGQTIENVVDTITGENNENRNQNRGQKNKQ
ncbi:hypothetical protein [Ferdinandcohnia sp. Marseille-Q9671]